jgi:hypothetical protein
MHRFGRIWFLKSSSHNFSVPWTRDFPISDDTTSKLKIASEMIDWVMEILKAYKMVIPLM